MKIIVVGATGFVGTEVIRQTLRNPSITAAIALARRQVESPIDAGPPLNNSKLHTFLLEDWTAPCPPDVQQAIAGADACIWSLAVTPSASKDMPFEEVTRICADYTAYGLASMSTLASNPFRFIYVSGVTIERDQEKSLPFLGPYRHMRGRVETDILNFAATHAPKVQVGIVKPGGIDRPGREKAVSALMQALSATFGGEPPRVHVSELAAAMLGMAMEGLNGRDTFYSKELKDMGKDRLLEGDYLV